MLIVLSRHWFAGCRVRARVALAVGLSCMAGAALPAAWSSPPAVAATGDLDGDGVADVADCAPLDPSVRPGALDVPELGFVDANCDGLDGDVSHAIFVSASSGSDAGAGTRGEPLKTFAAGLARAETEGKDVYLAAGSYAGVSTVIRVHGIYGGYDAATWQRSGDPDATQISHPITAMDVSGAANQGSLVVQLVALHGEASALSSSVYGLRALNGARVALDRVHVTADDAAPGADGAPPADRAANEPPGAPGAPASCTATSSAGGAGGVSPVTPNGGTGGNATADQPGASGASGSGLGGGAGGFGGSITSFDPSLTDGQSGDRGDPGRNGSAGPDGRAVFAHVTSTEWQGDDGADGQDGGPGDGGGGGGGGAGSVTGVQGVGGGGGGGGAGGRGGAGGNGGQAGGGSFGVFAHSSTVLVLDGSVVQSGNGGNGGDGAQGQQGGFGGVQGAGGIGNSCPGRFFGFGGNGGGGGNGGQGGGGGGGAGGPTVGMFSLSSTVSVIDASIQPNATVAGAGGDNAVTGTTADTGQRASILGILNDPAVADFDADDVVDGKDRCPLTAAAGSPDGCPPTLPPVTAPGQQPDGGGGGESTVPDRQPPRILSFDASPRRLRLIADSSGHPVRVARPAILRYTLTEDAAVTITIRRVRTGHLKAGRCSTTARRGTKCLRLVRVGALHRTAVQGANRLSFKARLAGRLLPAGRYNASLVATDAAHNTGVAAAFPFIIRRPI